MQIGNSYLRLNSIEILFARPWNPENLYSVIFWRDKRRYIFKILILSSLPLDSIQLVRKVWKHFYINTRRNLSEKRSNTSFLGTFPKKMYFQNIGYLKKTHPPRHFKIGEPFSTGLKLHAVAISPSGFLFVKATCQHSTYAFQALSHYFNISWQYYLLSLDSFLSDYRSFYFEVIILTFCSQLRRILPLHKSQNLCQTSQSSWNPSNRQRVRDLILMTLDLAMSLQL